MSNETRPMFCKYCNKLLEAYNSCQISSYYDDIPNLGKHSIETIPKQYDLKAKCKMQNRTVPNGQGKIISDFSIGNRFSVLSKPLAYSYPYSDSSRSKVTKNNLKSLNRGFQLAFWNAQSLRQKTQLVKRS